MNDIFPGWGFPIGDGCIITPLQPPPLGVSLDPLGRWRGGGSRLPKKGRINQYGRVHRNNIRVERRHPHGDDDSPGGCIEQQQLAANEQLQNPLVKESHNKCQGYNFTGRVLSERQFCGGGGQTTPLLMGRGGPPPLQTDSFSTCVTPPPGGVSRVEASVGWGQGPPRGCAWVRFCHAEGWARIQKRIPAL